MKSTQIATITFDNLPQAIAKVTEEVSEIRNHLESISKNVAPKQHDEWLTRAEVAKLLKVDLSTLWNWHKKGKLIPYALGNRVYYKKADVNNSLVRLGDKKGGSDE